MQFVRSCVLATLAWTLAFADTPSSWTPEFSFRFQTVSAVTPSPDGKMAVWVQTRPVMEAERSEQVSQIWAGSTDGSRRFQLTRGEKSAGSPAWSKDGESVYFLADRGGGRQIYRILLAGGEAEKITDFKGGIDGSFEVSPDGKSIAFTAREADPDEEKSKKEKRDMHVIDAHPLNDSLYVTATEPDANGKHKHRKVFEAKYHVADLNWSPDSRLIAFTHMPTSSADDWTRADVGEVDVASGTVRDIAATGASEQAPHYSPDGRYIAIVRSPNPARWAGDDRIVLINRQTSQMRELPATYDEQPSLVGWTADSSRLLFTESKHTRSVVSAMPVDGPAETVFEPTRGVANNLKMNSTGTWLGMAWETPDQAAEAYVMSAASHTPVEVSRANSDVPKLPLGRTEVFRWKSKDGLDVEGLLTYPVNYEKGKRVPLILNIHGGPEGVFSESFIGRASIYPIAVFAAKGYAVLRPNPRGSSGYGQHFRFANYKDWGGGDYQDDQTGVDALIAAGIADPDHLAIMGWSYGGYMTAWTITQTKRFKAAVIGAGVTNLWSFTGTSDIPGFLPDYFEGEAWDNFDVWRKHSPITYIKGVTTPTLLLHGEADERVPTTQGYEYYNALKRQGTLTKMVVYPRTPHGPREPKFILDIMQRHLDWVDKYVR